MVPQVESETLREKPAPDFTHRLEIALPDADRDRRRLAFFRRLRALSPLILLVGPLAAWHVFLSSHGGVHLTVTALAWLAFLLDVGVHIDTAVLSYLGLRALPSIVGVLLLVMTTAWLLFGQEPES